MTAKTDVVYTIKLPKTIKKYNVENISDLIKEEIYTKLLLLNVDSKETRKAHVKAIYNTLAKKSIKVNNGICPKCGGLLVLRSGKYGNFVDRGGVRVEPFYIRNILITPRGHWRINGPHYF